MNQNKSWLGDVLGTWPGPETEAELLQALREFRDAPARPVPGGQPRDHVAAARARRGKKPRS